MMFIFLISYNDIIHGIPGTYSHSLKAGKYTIICYGAQGGTAYSNGHESADGGRGALVKGVMTLSGPNKTFYLNVGGEGKKGKYGDRDGGYNGGGRSGRDKGSGIMKGNDGPGSGGGASDIRIDSNELTNRVMVAAGGSGACAESDGAPGGDLYGRRMIKNNIYDNSPAVTQTAGNENGVGGSGSSSSRLPGSGGGGGWRGGVSTGRTEKKRSNSYKAVSHSGSSYISGFPGCLQNNKLVFTEGEMTPGAQRGNGYIKIVTNYECPDNCYSCTGEKACTKCFDPYFAKADGTECVLTCPPEFYGENGKCIHCADNCKTCKDKAAICTSCKDGKSLYGNECREECPSNYTSENNVCVPCKSPCQDCSATVQTCTSCVDGYFLNGTQCVLDCGDGYLGFDKKCEKCTSNCNTCKDSVATCTSCVQGYHLYFYQCVLECPSGFLLIDNECKKCNPSCSECSDSIDKCTKCPRGYFLQDNKCVEECKTGFFGQDGQCVKCWKDCDQCASSSTICTSCTNGLSLYNNKCVKDCPIGTGSINSVCETCQMKGCSNCDGDINACKKCFSGYEKIGNKCVYQCFETPEESSIGARVLKAANCPTCPENCVECANSTICTTCSSEFILHNFTCIKKCPPNTILVDKTCKSCSVLNCASCQGNINICEKCNEGFVLHNNQCRKECPIGFFENSGKCENCDGSCLDCSEKDKCTSCQNGNLFKNKCIQDCPSDTIPFNNKCEECFNGCSSCQEAITTCTKCEDNYVFHHNQCIHSCPSGYTDIDGICKQCVGCSKCSGAVDKCDECPKGLYMDGESCVSNCGSGRFGANKQCEKCSSPCSECVATSETCIECIEDFNFYDGKCGNGCQEGFVPINQVCQPCTSNCATCKINQSYCLTCEPGYYLYGSVCDNSCPSGMVGIDGKCEECESPCLECISDQKTCTKCVDDYLYHENQCYEECPYNTIVEGNICTNCDVSCNGCYNSTVQCINCSEGFFRFGELCYSECSHVNPENFTDPSSTIFYGNNYETYTCDECTDKQCIDCSSNYSVCTACEDKLVLENEACYPPDYILVTNENYTEGDGNNWGYTVRKDKDVTIDIQVTKFINITEDTNGGAFYIINAAVNCNYTYFYNVTSHGGGGAIYVKNWKNLNNDVKFNKLYFEICKAKYGGAIYAYSSREQNTVTIHNCKFYSNEVDPEGCKTTIASYVGGNALFLTAQNADVKKCIFKNNKGTKSGVKIYNRFERVVDLEDTIVIRKNPKGTLSGKSVSMSRGANILISECELEISRKEQNSIFVEGDNLDSIEIVDCHFKGKLGKGRKYIGGKIHAQNIGKVKVSSCEFETKEKSAMNFEIIHDDLF